jgi:acetyl-CoA synthetase
MSTCNFAWEPTPDVVETSNLAKFLRCHGIANYADFLRRADSDLEWFWNAILEFFGIKFIEPYARIVDLSKGIEWPQWCPGGTTNIVLNCLDRYRGTPTWDKPAVIGEAEDGTHCAWTYADLDREVGRLAALMRSRDIRRGDVVALYLPMIPEAAVAFLAVVKIGGIVLPMFSGLGPQPIVQRLAHAQARAIITSDIAWRRGTRVLLKETIDRALQATDTVNSVFVLQRDLAVSPIASSRDVRWYPGESVDGEDAATEILDAEAPAMLMYTSGTTGEPKGTIHTHCGMLAKNALDVGLCVDMQPSDVMLWMSDMGWIVGPKMILSATLLGGTLIMAEGTPDWPSKDRLWQIAAKHRATMLGIVPTAVRQMMRYGSDLVGKHDLSCLRVTVSVGEPWTTDAWWWFFDEVCRRKIPILNYAGGTECGGAVLIGTLMRPLRPGAFGGPVPGCGADIVDEAGRSVAPNEIGELVMRSPSMGMSRGLWRAMDRYLENYWRVIPSVWVQGDLASRDEDGLWYLHGRSDDVIKIAGKRTGPAEIESVVMATGLVKDALIIGVSDPISGSALVCVCVPIDPQRQDELDAKISKAVSDQCGSSFRPKHYLFVSDLPRTRNQKNMRRVVRSIILGTPIGDASVLDNPEVIDDIRAAALARIPRALNAQAAH